jgi:pimeloyl-ACP methyl ester carboxylesterase
MPSAIIEGERVLFGHPANGRLIPNRRCYMTQRTEEMATAVVNDVRLAYAIQETGEIPLVMVHGSLETHQNWDWVVPHLPDSFRVLTYDRRGFGESERPGGKWGIREHVGDVAALIEHLGLAPAWVAGQSFGGSITLRLAGERPDLLRGIVAHEPGLFSLLEDDPELAPMLEAFPQLVAAFKERVAAGDHAGAAELFIEEGLGEGLWAKIPPEFRQMCIENAANTLDDLNDPESTAFDLDWIKDFTRPALLTLGDQTAPLFPPVITRLAEAMPSAEVREFTGAGHPIMVEQPEEFAEAITAFVRRHTKG